MRVWVRNKEAGKVLMLFPLSFYTYLLCPLLMGTDIWQEIEVLNQEFVRLGISQSVDYESTTSIRLLPILLLLRALHLPNWIPSCFLMRG